MHLFNEFIPPWTSLDYTQFICLLVIYGLLACDNGAYIERDDALRIINDWESGHVPDAVTHSLFNEVNDFERCFIYIIGSDYRFIPEKIALSY